MQLTEFLILSVIIGLIAFSLLTVMIINGYKRCQFCAGFWICCLLSLVYGFFYGFGYPLIVLPFSAVAICSFINK